MFVQLRKMLVGWLLVHTGTLPVAMRYANTLNSKATANKSDGESLATIWKSADMLAKAMRESEGNFMSSWARLQSEALNPTDSEQRNDFKCAELLLATCPLAAPPSKAGPPPADKLASTCKGLGQEVMQWLQSRTDPSAMTTCLQAQQSRALSRAAGLRLSASMLSVYAGQPHIVSHLLELVQRANNRRPAGKPPPPPTEPSQPHYSANLECCGVLAGAHLRAAFADNLEGLTAMIEPPSTPKTRKGRQVGLLHQHGGKARVDGRA